MKGELAISGEKPGRCQPIEEKVKIDEPAIRLPAGQEVAYSLIIGRLRQLQPALQVLLRSHVISRKHVCPSERAQKEILG